MTEQLTVFLGWATLIHLILLTIITACLILFRRWVVSIHSAMFNLEEKDLTNAYFQYLANYKILVITFFAVPWIVLRFVL